MKIYKRRNSSYYWVDYVNYAGKRIRKSLQTNKKVDAITRAKLIEKKDWLLSEGMQEFDREPITLGKLHSEYIPEVIDVSKKAESSKANDKRQLERFVNLIGPDTLLTDVTESECNRYINKLKETLVDITIVKCVSICRRMFKYALKPPYNLKHNPFEWCQSAKELNKQTEKKPIVPWNTILGAIDQAPDIDTKMFWTLLAYTGMAPVDASKVTKEDFINGSYKRTKSGVPFMLYYHPEIAKYGDAIFGLFQKKSQRDTSNRKFKALTGHITYDIRRTFATSVMNKFKSAEDAIAFTGHTNVKTLVDHYAHADPELVAKTLSQIVPSMVQA
tara:strand:+ start:1598 stop:2590 length:993 start_codon:yes stop_codon:yes gene_type:complete